MSVSINVASKSYTFAEGEHSLRDILNYYGVEVITANEVREKILAPVHKRYYGKEATQDQLWHWTNRFLSANKELPNSVLIDFCKGTDRIPEVLQAAS